MHLDAISTEWAFLIDEDGEAGVGISDIWMYFSEEEAALPSCSFFSDPISKPEQQDKDWPVRQLVL